MAVQLVITPNYAFGAGEFQPGARAFTYESGTTTPFIVYADEALTTPHPQPIVADASGSFPTIWSDAANDVKAVVTAADGSSLFTIDKAILGNVEIGEASDLGFDPITNNTATDAQTAIANNSDAIALLQDASGARELIELVDLSVIDVTQPHTFPLFDPTRYVRYEWVFSNCFGTSGGTAFEIYATTDGGTSYVNTNTVVRRVVSDGVAAGAVNSATLWSGDNFTSRLINGVFSMEAPEAAAPTMGRFEIFRSSGTTNIPVQSGYYLRSLSEAVNGIRLDDLTPFLSGEIYFYGIVR